MLPAHSKILVTGGTGFLGSHVILQLLNSPKAFHVRGTVRPGRSPFLKSMFPGSLGRLETVEIPSLTADYSTSSLFKGIDALIHCASPNARRCDSNREILEGTLNGCLDTVRAAIASGVKKIIVTGSTASLGDPEFKAGFMNKLLTPNDFGSTCLEDLDLDRHHGLYIYVAAKTIAEKKIWEMAREHSDVDISTILPPAIFGPTIPHYSLPAAARDLNTIHTIYSLISNGQDTYPNFRVGWMGDVRDIARAHVLALDAPPLQDGRKKRFILCSKIFNWKELRGLIQERRPELAHRLPREDVVPTPTTFAPLDTSLAKEVLGLDYIPWQETILDCLEVGLRWEQQYGVPK